MKKDTEKSATGNGPGKSTPPDCLLRYFVDERSGCIAVRDRSYTDPDYSGLHADTVGVIRYWHGKPETAKCPTCGHLRSNGFSIADEDRQSAHALCDRLNAGADVLPSEVRAVRQ